MKFLFFGFFLFLGSFGFAQESMETLLDIYREESALSKITKHESAGFLELYTREELEKMQVHTLLDVFKTIPGLILTKDSIGINTFRKPKMPNMSDAAARLYINEHDVSSASFGSAFLIWADMPIEYVDHIEVYKATSSIEFGNEVGSLVIKVYTKTAQREEGGKARVMLSSNGGYDTNLYYGQSLANGLSYFAYANRESHRNDNYYHQYNTKRYTIKDNKESYTFFANLKYKRWVADIGYYDKNVDAFVGPGIYKTPSGEGVKSKHFYLHLSKKFANEVRVQIAYDHMQNDGRFVDENGIVIFDPNSLYNGKWIVEDYRTILDDHVCSAIIDKKFLIGKNHLLLGGFYKYKKFKDRAIVKGGQNYTLPLNYYAEDVTASNSLQLSSLYFENSYHYSGSLRFILSAKEDFYRYKNEVDSQNKFIGRLAVIKNIDNFQIKGFTSYSYIPATFLELYNENNLPIKVNPKLKYPTQILYSGSIRYKKKRHSLEGMVTFTRLKNAIYLDALNGYQNNSQRRGLTTWELAYKYIYNMDNKLYVSYARGENNQNLDESPSYTLGIRLFNRYKKFDFYNELTLRSSYSQNEISVGRSYDYTASVKYHISKDIACGFRGDNIFNSGYKQIYTGYDEAIAVVQQRFWLNFEVLF